MRVIIFLKKCLYINFFDIIDKCHGKNETTISILEIYIG